MKAQLVPLNSSINRFIQHIMFWMLSYYVLLRVFSTGSQAHQIDYYYTFLFHIPLLVGVYINLEVLIPRFLVKENRVAYVLSACILIAIASLFNLWFFDYAADKIFTGYYFISYYNFWDIAQFFIIYLTASSLLKLSRGWFQLLKTEKELAIANREKLEAELKALKSQINPHFLFNSLNSLYALALKEDKKAPQAILKLSDALRYIIYECNVDHVSLKDEIAFLSNYVDLQKLRSDESTNIDLEIVGDPGNLKIAPMLFIPFVENGFKHGVKGDSFEGFIEIKLILDQERLEFSVKNNIGTVDEDGIQKSGGIGLDNVVQRLKLLYGDKYQLDIDDQQNIYSICLKLNLA